MLKINVWVMEVDLTPNLTQNLTLKSSGDSDTFFNVCTKYTLILIFTSSVSVDIKYSSLTIDH